MMNPLSNPVYLLSPLVAAAICLSLMALVLLKSRRTSSTWIFCCLLLSVALISLLLFGMRSSPDVYRAVLWERAVPVVGFAVFVFYYHFTLLYTQSRRRKSILYAAYLVLPVAAVLAPTGLFVKEMRLEYYGYAPITGPLLIPLMTMYIFMLGAAIHVLTQRYRVSPSYEERNRLTYLAGAGLFPVAGAILDSSSNLPPASMWGNLAFCILCTIAIMKYHLLDIRLVIRKGTAYLIVSGMVAVPYVSVILLLSRMFERSVPVWTHFIILVLLAFGLQPLWIRVQRLVDRWFYRERYDFLKELENFSQETHDISDPNQLTSSLVRLIGRALRSSSVHLLLSSPSKDFITASSAGKEIPKLTIGSGSSLLRWLRSHGGILRYQGLDTIPQLRALTQKMRNELEKMRAKLIVPLKNGEKELVGILIVGEKLSEQPYSKDDERLVVTVASRVAVGLENARLYALERSTRMELERQNEQKTEFLHSVAHELKTPLTAIISSSGLLGTKPSSTKLRQRLTRNITWSAWLMDKRVSELLDLAKIQVGGLEIKSETLEVGVIIEEVASQLLPIFKNKAQSLELEVPDSLPQVKGDREKLEQILINLLSNANKFSHTGVNITLRAREVNNKVVVQVEDAGPAIADEEKEKLFNPYYRGDKRQGILGLGLGLAISKKLVELHRGEIWVEVEPGKGNTFAFSLPTSEQSTEEIR